MPHDTAEIPVWGLQQEMVVIAHQTVPMDHNSKAFMNFGQGIQKGVEVRGGVKDRLASASTINDMIARPLVFDPDGSGHGPNIPNSIL